MLILGRDWRRLEVRNERIFRKFLGQDFDKLDALHFWRITKLPLVEFLKYAYKIYLDNNTIR